MTESQLLESLGKLGNNLENSFGAIVEANNPSEDHISVRCMNGTLYEDVRKRASLNEDATNKKGIIITPSEASFVIVSRISNSNELYIAMFSEIESVSIDGGENGGLVKLQELTENLNSLKDMVEAINTALPSAFTAVGASTAAAGANGAANYNSSMAGKTISFTDMENIKFKH